MKQWLARSTIFGLFFAVTSFYLALHGLLNTVYVAAIGAVHGFITLRAIAEDRKDASTK